MEQYIDVRKIMGANDTPVCLFFDPVGPDRYTAMERKRITEQMFEEWYRKINAFILIFFMKNTLPAINCLRYMYL